MNTLGNTCSVLRSTKTKQYKSEKERVIIMFLQAMSRLTNKGENVFSRKGALNVCSSESIGLYNGTVMLTAADPNYLVTTTVMKVGAYTIAAQPLGSHVVTVTHTKVGTLDTLGIITIIGTDSDGKVVTEIITPTDSAVVTGAKGFEAITSITGSGWVIAGSDNDTLVVGIGAIVAPVGKYIFAVMVVTDTVIASETYVSGASGPKLVSLTALIAGQVYYGQWSSLTLTSGESVVYYNVL